MVRGVLREYSCEILEQVTENAHAFAKMRFSGIHVGEFRGYAPTGKTVQWVGLAFLRIQGPMIVEP
jgi:predicted ester cyclase